MSLTQEQIVRVKANTLSFVIDYLEDPQWQRDFHADICEALCFEDPLWEVLLDPENREGNANTVETAKIITGYLAEITMLLKDPKGRLS